MKCTFYPSGLVACLLFAQGLAAQDKVGDSPYYPTKVGTTWHYRIGEKKVVVKVAKHEKFGDLPCARVETQIEGQVKAYEHIAVTKDGLVRVGYNGEVITPPVLFLKLPPNAGDSWPIDSRAGTSDAKEKKKSDKEKKSDAEAVKGTYSLSKDKIKVPAGEFETLKTHGQVEITVNGMPMTGTFTRWFAEGKGIVKMENMHAGSRITLELEKFEPGE